MREMRLHHQTFSRKFVLLLLLWIIGRIYSSNRGYDRHCAQFDPQGHLIQLEYAKKAVAKYGGLLFAMKTKAGIAFYSSLKTKSTKSKLVLQSFSQKVTQLHDQLLIGISGLGQDAMVFTEIAKTEARDHYEKFQAPIPIEQLCEKLSKKLYKSTTLATRPFGVKVLVAGYDVKTRDYKIYSIEPDGSFNSWKAVAVGEAEDRVNEELLTYLQEHAHGIDSVEESLRCIEAIDKKLFHPEDAERISSFPTYQVVSGVC